MSDRLDIDSILDEIKVLIDNSVINNILDDSCQALEKPLDLAMKLIQKRAPYYKWVGIYWLKNGHLELGPYAGAETDHSTIEIGQGVCGMAVATNTNQVIDDVGELDNYLACSIQTRSEIVVLIRDSTNNIIGQIDADGHSVSDFDKNDELFLERLASSISELYSNLKFS